jgi:hypothetical protein
MSSRLSHVAAGVRISSVKVDEYDVEWIGWSTPFGYLTPHLYCIPVSLSLVNWVNMNL